MALAFALLIASLIVLSYMLGLEKGIAMGFVLFSIAGSLNVLMVGFFSQHYIKAGFTCIILQSILISLRFSSGAGA